MNKNDNLEFNEDYEENKELEQLTEEINNEELDEEPENKYTICSECETIIDDNDKFCPNCGCLFLDSSDLKYNKLEQTIKTILTYSTVVSSIITILSILIFIGGIIVASEAESGFVFFIFLITAILTCVSSLVFEAFANWFAYSLKSLYEIRRILFKKNK